MQTKDVYDANAATHGMLKVEGILALEKSRIIIEEELSVGDTVNWFQLPDGRLLISKDPDGVRIEKISPAYYHLEAGATLEEV
jgi:hypothetical protein